MGVATEGDRIDEHLTVAIVDVAHVVTTHALAAGDLRVARMATETAALAAPYEEIPRLDLAAVAAAEGHHAEAQRIIRDEICNRTDDDNAPQSSPPAPRKSSDGAKAGPTPRPAEDRRPVPAGPTSSLRLRG